VVDEKPPQCQGRWESHFLRKCQRRRCVRSTRSFSLSAESIRSPLCDIGLAIARHLGRTKEAIAGVCCIGTTIDEQCGDDPRAMQPEHAVGEVSPLTGPNPLPWRHGMGEASFAGDSKDRPVPKMVMSTTIYEKHPHAMMRATLGWPRRSGLPHPRAS
jgi:hypothetical protein